MAALIAVTIAFPVIFLGSGSCSTPFPRARTARRAGTASTADVGGVLYEFGFIVAATLGVTGARSTSPGNLPAPGDQGRSRWRSDFARIPPGLAIIGSIGGDRFRSCAWSASSPRRTAVVRRSNGARKLVEGRTRSVGSGTTSTPSSATASVMTSPPRQISHAAPGRRLRKGNGPGRYRARRSPTADPVLTPAELRSPGPQIAVINYGDYAQQFLAPPFSLMVETGLWLEARGGHRLSRGPGPRVAPRTTDRGRRVDGGSPDRAHVHLPPAQHPALRQPPARHGRRSHGPSRTRQPGGVGRRGEAALAAARAIPRSSRWRHPGRRSWSWRGWWAGPRSAPGGWRHGDAEALRRGSRRDHSSSSRRSATGSCSDR